MTANLELANLRRRVTRARKFPTNTCGASRHLHMIADNLLDCPHLDYLSTMVDREHVAESMLIVLESLWKARTELAKLHKAGK
jgi:hypothetical protein